MATFYRDGEAPTAYNDHQRQTCTERPGAHGRPRICKPATNLLCDVHLMIDNPLDELSWFIDAGADLVVGSPPHVIQGWEVYQGRYIVYSLG